MVSKSDDERAYLGNLGYDDVVGNYYPYDSNVPNHQQIRVGDLVVVRQDEWVAGWGIVEKIDVMPNQRKTVIRCPTCGGNKLGRRKRKLPEYRCSECKKEFEASSIVTEEVPVTTFCAHYSNMWHEAVRPVTARDLKVHLLTDDFRNAIRRLNPETLPTLINHLSGRATNIEIEVDQSDLRLILGGHQAVATRRRRGQREFRFAMMTIFGENCVITGPNPPQTLEAAHLNSFASDGIHRRDQGLLLRRDLHSLFDSHMLSINPALNTVEIAPFLRTYET